MISRFVFAGAERAPEALALVCNGRRLTYGELARAIEATIQAFEGQGVAGSGYAVIALADMLDFWIVSLALRELGLTTVPTMSAQNAAALGLDGVRIAVMHPSDPWPGFEALCAREGWPLARVHWADGFARPVEVGRLRTPQPGGHVLQTSATTGAYKKVLMAPSFETAFLKERGDLDGYHAEAKTALFDFGGWTGAGYKSAGAMWLAGGAVVVDQSPDPRVCLAEPGVSHGAMLPTHLARVLEGPAGAFPYRPGMKLCVGGSTARQALIDAALERVTPIVVNAMGSTEAQTFAETRLLTPEDRRWHQLVPSRGAQLVDDADQPVPAGQVGRLRVSSRDGPTSYLGNPEATAAFFRGGWFYTGDLAVQRADGRMALMGRSTDVINVQGQKISPAAYEDALCERLGVAGVCLFSRQNDKADEQLHVAIEAPGPLAIGRLTEALRAVLAGFPTAQVHYVKALPRNPMGKVMRAELQSRLTPP